MYTTNCKSRRSFETVYGLTLVLCSQAVRGDLQLALEWQFTREGLLLREVQLLEHILAQKVEMAARMKPVPAAVAEAWLATPPNPLGNTSSHAHGHANAMAGSPRVSPQPLDSPGARGATRMSALDSEEDGGTLPGDADLLPDVNAQQISESYFINLELSVL